MGEEGEDIWGVADFLLQRCDTLRKNGAKKNIKRRAVTSCLKVRPRSVCRNALA